MRRVHFHGGTISRHRSACHPSTTIARRASKGSNNQRLACASGYRAVFESKKERKCMGIEPTDHMFFMQPNGFEDRGGHQSARHFRGEMTI